MKCSVRILLACLLLMAGSFTTRAQSFEIQQLILDVEKLSQLKNIYSDLMKGYDILSEGYNAVSDISQGNFDLHKVFLDGLLKASPVVQKYQKVGDIIDCELKIIAEYGTSFNRFKQDNNFSPDEIIYISKVYNNLIDQSIKGLSDLTTVITDNALRASDDERLKEIDQLDAGMQDRLGFLRYFNNNTTILALQRAREKNDVNTIRNIYGINN
ncbi:MAG: TerB family tellurite resistance protein [Parafilimonas sp.]